MAQPQMVHFDDSYDCVILRFPTLVHLCHAGELLNDSVGYVMFKILNVKVMLR